MSLRLRLNKLTTNLLKEGLYSCLSEQTSVWAATDETSAESEIAEVGCDVKDVNMQQGFTPTAGKVVQHVFLSKTVRPIFIIQAFLDLGKTALYKSGFNAKIYKTEFIKAIMKKGDTGNAQVQTLVKFTVKILYLTIFYL